MIDQQVTDSFFDEIQKIAASRWKQVLRAGDLGAEDVSRLTGSGILDYGREIAGLQRGTGALAKKHGITVKDVGAQDLKAGARDLLTGKGTAKIKDTLQSGMQASTGGGYLALPLESKVLTAPGISPLTKGLKGETREAADALMKRHEIDEILQARKGLAKAYRDEKPFRVFVPGRAPEGIRERLGAGSIQKVKELSKKLNVPSEITEQTLGPTPVNPKMLAAGRHFSPEVLIRESRNVATLPPEVAQAVSKFRKGETQTMGPLGFQYGREAPVGTRRDILRAFERGEI